jgi:hypothetical protein
MSINASSQSFQMIFGVRIDDVMKNPGLIASRGSNQAGKIQGRRAVAGVT